MKSIQNLFGIILIIILSSCGKDEIINPLDNSDLDSKSSEITTRSNQNGPFNTPIYSQTELIVQYLPDIDDATKDSLRSYYDVIYYEICQLCSDERIEKWRFDIDVQIEPKKHVIETTAGIVIEEVDFNFEFTENFDVVDVGEWEDTSYEPFIVSDNTEITIAILDTGCDFYFPFWYDGEEPIPVLYNASETAEGEEISGWDFVNSDPNTFDDYAGRHGTILAFEYQNILNGYGVPFQILPVKIFDQDAKINYFNLLCGTYYALQRADIVQMSFGWYDDGIGDYESTIFKNLIDEFNDVIVITSAGNGNGGDDDSGDNTDTAAHYPSSYDSDNIIAVGATNKESTFPAEWSNYGSVSVDFWAVGMEVPFYDYDYEPIPGGVHGTSFAAPQIGAQAALHQYFWGGVLSPEEVINMINLYGIIVPDTYDGMVKYDKYYPLLIE